MTAYIDSCVIIVATNLSSLQQEEKVIKKYIEKEGPKTDPCGTPLVDFCQVLNDPLTITRCSLLER